MSNHKDNKTILTTLIDRVQSAGKNLPTKLPSNARHASIAAIIRWHPRETTSRKSTSLTVDELLKESWTETGELQLLFIQRALQKGDPYSGQIGFPGGKSDPEDIDHLHTAVRECNEELGLNLNSNTFLFLGSLPPREIINEKTNNTNLVHSMIFLQMSQETPKMKPSMQEVARTMWIPIAYLLKNPVVMFDAAPFDTISFLRHGIDLKQTPSVPYLWGLTLRLTQEILGLPVSTAAVYKSLEDKTKAVGITEKRTKL